MSGDTRAYVFACGNVGTEAALALLAELDFDAFEEQGEQLRAYLPEARHDERFATAVRAIADRYELRYTSSNIADENWNLRWEESFAPAEVGDFLRVRAPFHPPSDRVAIELEIVPEMSFGTGHHETTHLMAELLRDRAPVGMSVFDFGTGTGVLAMVARRLGAASVVAADHDRRCVESTRANAARNAVHLDDVRLCDERDMPSGPFDLILANIQRGVLVRAMPTLASRCRMGGELWLSGILRDDLAPVDAAAEACGFRRLERRARGRWLACRYDAS